MATTQSFGGKINAFDGTIFFQSLYTILRTGRCESTFRSEHWGYHPLINFDECDERKTEDVFKGLHVWPESFFLLQFHSAGTTPDNPAIVFRYR